MIHITALAGMALHYVQHGKGAVHFESLSYTPSLCPGSKAKQNLKTVRLGLRTPAGVGLYYKFKYVQLNTFCKNLLIAIKNK